MLYNNVLKKQITSRGIKVANLCMDTNIGQETIYKYTKCDYYYPQGRLSVFLKLSEHFGVDVENFMFDDWDPNSVKHTPIELETAIAQHYGKNKIEKTRRELRKAMDCPKDYLKLYRYSTYRDFPYIKDAYIIANYLGYSINALWGERYRNGK